MERSKNQAVYRYLPGIWVSDNSDAGRPITAIIDNWNWRDMEGIYERFIVGEIKRQIRMFGDCLMMMNIRKTIKNRLFLILQKLLYVI